MRALMLLLMLPSLAVAQRTRYTINDGWKFTRNAVEFAERPLVGDAGWQNVSLPHTWNAADPFDDEPSYYRGVGWYRRPLDVPVSLRGKRVFLHFEGTNQVADVYVNGAFAGRHEGGYTAFTIDITRYVRFGEAGNLLAVQVNNAHDAGIPPLSVGFALYGGIYRDVWLIATDPVHVQMLDHGSSGVFVTTPRVSRDRAETQVRGTVVNDGGEAAHLRIVSTILDAHGTEVARSVASQLRVRAGGAASFDHALPAVMQPHLWSPDEPYLYTINTDIYEGAVLRDRVRNPLGFRWFRFDAQQGFFLNGERLQLRGTNRHQDYAGLGSALSNDLHVRDLEWIKGMGANFLRLAHYPQDPAVLAAADRLGLLIWEEIPVVNYITISERFTANAKQMLREMIRQHYNHPSAILWGLMNEVFLWSPEGARIGKQGDTTYTRQVRDFARELDRTARTEDAARYTAMAMHMSGDYDASGVSGITQVLGLNTYNGWYSGKFDEFGPMLDRRHAQHPEQTLLISEYGSGSDLTLNSNEPERFDHSSTWHRLFHEAYLRQARARPFISGTAIWNQFDFSQPHIGETMPNMNQKGMLTFDRRPKDVYYLYKANWTAQPFVYIASRDWTHRAGSDAAQPIDVYANVDRVELFHNGRSLGSRTPDDVRKMSWAVPFVQGVNVLEARGERGGANVTDHLEIRFDYRSPNLNDPAVPFRELAVNVGSRAEFADAEGIVWVADQPYRAAAFGYTGGIAALLDRALVITNTRQPALYASVRSGIESYRFDIPAGAYEVELRFAEPLALRPGERVFDVLLNGTEVLHALDLTARYGRGRAAAVIITTSVAPGQGLTITFRAAAGEPVLNAIRVRKH